VSRPPSEVAEPKLTRHSIIVFYPFCAFFTLYYHILSSTDPSEYEEDIYALEQVVKAMSQLSCVRADFAPIAEAMSALNDVSRAVHSGDALQTIPRCEQRSQELPTTNFQPFPPVESLQNLSSDLPLQLTEPNGAFGVPFQLQNQFVFNQDPPHGDYRDPDRPDTAQTVTEPLSFMRAIENELIWRNWHESWWNNNNANVQEKQPNTLYQG
jgi:hypothetical protein